jgi:hypothetical protein
MLSTMANEVGNLINIYLLQLMIGVIAAGNDVS